MQSPVTGPGPPGVAARLAANVSEAVGQTAILAGAKVLPGNTPALVTYVVRTCSGSHSAQVVPTGKEDGILSPVSLGFEGDLPIIPKLALPRLAKPASIVRPASADQEKSKVARRAPQVPVRIAPHPAGLAKLLGMEKLPEAEEGALETEESGTADGTVPIMKLCQVCNSSPAVVYCAADAACLCQPCDVEIHSANALSSRHERVSLLGVKDAVLCEAQAETGSVEHTVTLSSSSKSSRAKRARTQGATSASVIVEDLVTSPSAADAQEVPSRWGT